MYVVVVVALMLVLPIMSILLEGLQGHAVPAVATFGKWFVFWGVGARLVLAGLRQIIQPRFTAEAIFGVRDSDAPLIVRELGFANVAIGGAGLASIFLHGWILPLAVVGAVFYGLAGINHMINGKRNMLRNVAMTSDVFASAVLLIISVGMARMGAP